MRMMPWLLVVLVSIGQAAQDWSTCGALQPQYDRTACPPSSTCCKQKWSPSEGEWGCCIYEDATCCSNGYTCCPKGTTCHDSGSGWAVTTTCVNATSSIKPGMPGGGQQVCKQGGNLPFSPTKKNVVIMGDSVSIGYAPKVATALADIALVQHSPWGGDGGAEETQYGFQCIEYLLRAPDGTPQAPDVLWFNWGLHNLNSNRIPGQAGPVKEYGPYLDKIVARLAQMKATTTLIFGITSPMLCNATTDSVVLSNNKIAVDIMKTYGIATVDMHAAIVAKCGPVPQSECFGSKGCFCPHCPAHGGLGYAWLANTTIAPAIRSALQLA